MWKWISSLKGALCQRIGDFTCGWSLRSGTQLEPGIYSLLEKSLITLWLLHNREQLFVSPMAQEPALHIWPRGADSSHAAEGKILICHDFFYIMPHLKLYSNHL